MSPPVMLQVLATMSALIIQVWHQNSTNNKTNQVKSDNSYFLSTQGLTYYQLGQWRLAMKHYRQALLQFKVVDDWFGLGQTYYRLGVMLLQHKRYELAHHCAAMAIRQLTKVDLCIASYGTLMSQYAATLHLLGSVNYYQGRHGLALRQLEKTLSIRYELQDAVGEALTLVMVGRVYKAQQKNFYALACYQGALDICQEQEAQFEGSWFEAQVRYFMAELCEHCGHWNVAAEHYLDAIVLGREVEANF